MNITTEIQNDLQVGGYINFQSNELGLDSLNKCIDKQHFQNFQLKVNYHFNELGYREVPVKEYLEHPIIVIGDSFTVGLGLPIDLIYPRQLKKILNTQVLNFSLNGASNKWINRKLSLILKHINPAAVIIHYTFTHRREKNQPDWFDDERTLCMNNINENDKEDWLINHNQIQDQLKNIPAIYSAIPNWHTDTSLNHLVYIPKVVDFARDGFHYGPNTSKFFAENLVELLTS